MTRGERIRGCILGGAIGDALGAGIEFLSLAEIRARHGDQGLTDYAPAYGRTGAITDDTQMTLFTMSGMIAAAARYEAKGIVDLASMVDRAYAAWLATQGERSARWPGYEDRLAQLAGLRQRRAPGNTCLSALRGERMGTVADPVNDSKGCGGVMRIAPVGLAGWTDAFARGCELAAITHGHPSGYLAAGALAEIVAAIAGDGGSGRPGLVAGLDRAEAMLRARTGHEETVAALAAARALAASDAPPSPEAVETLGAGWVAEEALAIAVYCALVAGDFAHGVLLAVNHSGDSDSTGAICGNLLGAALGPTALPAGWLAGLELRDTVEALCDEFIAEFAPEPI